MNCGISGHGAGQPVVAAVLIEPDGEPKKLFRITLPSPLQLQYGTRVIVDQQAPLTGPFFTCFSNGCMADYEATSDLIGKLKHGSPPPEADHFERRSWQGLIAYAVLQFRGLPRSRQSNRSMQFAMLRDNTTVLPN
jgi:hypothetical protein